MVFSRNTFIPSQVVSNHFFLEVIVVAYNHSVKCRPVNNRSLLNIFVKYANQTQGSMYCNQTVPRSVMCGVRVHSEECVEASPTEMFKF